MTNRTEEKRKYKEKPVKEKTVTDELNAVLDEIAHSEPEEPKKGEPVTMLDETSLMISERHYRLVSNHRDGFNPEALGERFTDVLSRYDYIVGDWGYDQLRLKGFFRAEDRKASPEQRIDSLEDYLYEYCNFGCAYFVIERIGGKREHKQNRRRRSKKSGTSQNKQAHVEEKKAPVQQVKKKKPTIKNRKTANKYEKNDKHENKNDKREHKKPTQTNKNKGKGGAGFTIRQRED